MTKEQELDRHIDWLRTFGHIHRDTVRLMEELRQQPSLMDIIIGAVFAGATFALGIGIVGLAAVCLKEWLERL